MGLDGGDNGQQRGRQKREGPSCIRRAWWDLPAAGVAVIGSVRLRFSVYWRAQKRVPPKGV